MHPLAEKYWRPWFDLRGDTNYLLYDVTDFMLRWVTEAVHGVLWIIAYAVESLLLVRVGTEHEQTASFVVMRKARHGRPVSGVPP